MKSAEKTRMTGFTWAVIVLLGVGVVLLGVFAQPSSPPAATPSAEPPAADAPPATVETPTQQTSEQAAAEAFLVENLPRRLDGDPLAMGAVDAPVVLTEWADYRCPFCSVWAEETLPNLQRYIDDGTLRVEFRDLAIYGDQSIRAATAARAAGRQGRYFEFSHALFAALPNEGRPDISDELVLDVVADLGLDEARFARDWADPALADAVLADTREAQQMGLSSTPVFVVGGQFIAGAQPLEVFEQVIDQQAARLG